MNNKGFGTANHVLYLILKDKDEEGRKIMEKRLREYDEKKFKEYKEFEKKWDKVELIELPF